MKRLAMYAVALFAVFALVPSASTAQPHGRNLIVNGSFRLAPKPGSFATYGVGSHAIVGWTITKRTVDLIGTYWASADGGYSLDMDGTPGAGGVTQTIATVPGKHYRLSFALAGNPDGAPTVKVLAVWVGPIRKVYTFSIAHSSRSNMGWRSVAWNFVARSPRTRVGFESLDLPGPSNLCGPALSAVSVFAT
jgi:choice-of-anchor C domain-containing protein